MAPPPPPPQTPWRNYWGKARPNEQQQARWHPLVCHCLDVAASGAELLWVNPRLKASFERISGYPGEQLLPWILFFLALHDLGKFSVPFQQQVPDLLEELQGPMPTFPSEVRHDRLGYWFYSRRFASWYWQGWSSKRRGCLGIPAWAGMSRRLFSVAAMLSRVPRVGGDEPRSAGCRGDAGWCSPRGRG